MDILSLLLYFGFAFILFEAGKILTGKNKTLFLHRIIVLLGLLIFYIIFIFFIPGDARHPVFVLVLISITTFFTMFSTFIKNIFYRNFIPNMVRETNILFLVYLCNLDFHLKGLLRLKKILPLLHEKKEDFTEELKKIQLNNSLRDYLPWNQDVLRILLFFHQTEIAASFYDTLHIDLSKPGITLDFISLIINMLIKKRRLSDIPPYFHYIQTHFRGSAHLQLVLYLYLSFYVHTGSRDQFIQLIDNNPILKKSPILPYWEALLYIKTGQVEKGITLLTRLKENLAPPLQSLIPQIDEILKNPGIYTETPEEGQKLAATITPPRSNSTGTNETALPGKKLPQGIFFLCAFVFLATLVQFALSLAGTHFDIIGFRDVVPLDYISLGAYSDYFVNKGEWGRLLTAIFLHAGWLHLLVNVYGLFVTGRIAERAFGTFPMISIFILSGLTGNFASHIFSPYPLSVGASGGVFGVLASIFVFVIWRRKFITQANLRSFFINFAVIMGINIMIGLQNPRINNSAHLGGFAGGLIFSLLCIYLIKNPGTRKLLHTVSRILVIASVVALLFLWPQYYNQDYIDVLSPGKGIRVNGYSMQVPDLWETFFPGKENTEEEGIRDFLTGNIIRIFKDTETIPGGDLEETIHDEIKLYTGPDNFGKDYELGKPLIKLNNGWYSFSLRKKSEKEDYYDFITFYTKALDSSVCRVMSSTLKKYANEFDRQLYRVLETVEE
jgi:rhomboid protease GluP